jgi:phosphate transport system substrate-binding protein
MAEEFRAVAPDVRVTVGVSGTGGGFQKFCAGEIDISDASREIKDSERKACTAAGIEFIELRVGLDGIAVVTNRETDFLFDGITSEQLHTIFTPEAEGVVTRWNQVEASWPDEEIQIFAPDTDSGTFDFFTEEVNGDEGVSRADYTASADDNVLVIGISGDTGSLGYFGYAYYAENSDRLQVLAVDGVVPSDATVGDGSYSLARPLFIYVRVSSLQEKPQVREFVRFYLSDESIPLVNEVGYTSIPQDELDVSRAMLEAAISN